MRPRFEPVGTLRNDAGPVRDIYQGDDSPGILKQEASTWDNSGSLVNRWVYALKFPLATWCTRGVPPEGPHPPGRGHLNRSRAQAMDLAQRQTIRTSAHNAQMVNGTALYRPSLEVRYRRKAALPQESNSDFEHRGVQSPNVRPPAVYESSPRSHTAADVPPTRKP